MTDDPSNPIVPSNGGLFDQIGMRVRLILRLLKDRRVHPLPKLLPIGSLVYLLVPDLAPGPLDDAAILWLGAYLFVELCPPDVVAEHQRELESVVEGEWRERPPDEPDQDID